MCGLRRSSGRPVDRIAAWGGAALPADWSVVGLQWTRQFRL
jgi:hypothetical protein